MDNKFDNLDELIEKYIEQIKEHTDRLGIHVEFEIYMGWSNRVVEKIEAIKNTKDDEEKIKHIVEFTIYGGATSTIKVKYKNNIISIEPTKNYLHSYSNAARLSSILLHSEKDANNDQVLNGDDILNYGDLILEYLDFINENPIETSTDDFWNEDRRKKYINNNDTAFLKNKVIAPFDELKFWYFSANKNYKDTYDTFPLVNGSLITTLRYLSNIYKQTISVETLYNTFQTFKNKMGTQGLDLPIYIYIDQLANLIHKLKPNDIVVDKVTEACLEFYQKVWNTIQSEKVVELQNELNTFKNIIYHGAPGTGKTFEVNQEIDEHIKIYGEGKKDFIQFHASYYYEDFIGGLKPTSGDTLTLRYTNGIFKKLCKDAAKYEIAYYEQCSDETLTEKTKIDKEVILELSDGKKLKIHKNLPVLAQFPPFFIIIDEINRADLSKVFGELLYAIEDDYRGFENRFKLSASNIETEDTAVYWEKNETKGEAYFFVPKNLYIRGTMNDIDKSIDSIDFAFRRRFKWIEKRYEQDKIKYILEKKDINIENIEQYLKSCTSLNKMILKDISIADESYEIGHAIFANISKYIKQDKITRDNKKALFEHHIESILYNYLKMDYGNEHNNNDKFKNQFIN
jgi:5-methylcytosine-specific restriction protein B